MGNIFYTYFITPITNILVLFYHLLYTLHIPYALGFSIVALTAFIRIILFPLMSAQIKASNKMQKIAPHIANLKEKHKGDQKKQQEEMMRLYKEHGVNPAAGCLPTLIQLPVIISLYNVLNTTVAAHSIENINKINKILYFPFLKIDRIWDTSFFGLSLFNSPSKILPHDPFVLIFPIIAGFSQLILSKMMLPATQVPKEQRKDDFQSAFQSQSMIIFPLMIGFFSYTLPVGLSLYWITLNIFGILQQYILVGAGGLAVWLNKSKNI